MSKGAVATRPQQQVQTADQATLIGMVDQRAEQFRSLLGGDERAYERFRTLALHAITSNPDLLRCDPISVIEAVRASASMGLELNGLMGEGYIIAYGGKAQFQVGWRGLLRLARRSGDIASLDAQCVFEHDTFQIDLGSDPRITHRPSLAERGNRFGAYAYARLTSGELVTEWMPNADIEMVRRSSRARDAGPWVQWPDEMARKTVLKRLCKRLPLDSLAQQALEIEARPDNTADEPQRPTRSSVPSPAIQRVHQSLGIEAPGSDEASPVPSSTDEPPPADDPGARAAAADTGKPMLGTCGAAPPDDDPLGLSSGGVCRLTGEHRVHRNDQGTWPA